MNLNNIKIPNIKEAYPYLIIITFVFIYYHYIIDKYGDFISNFPSYDLLKKYKCAIKFNGCEDQVLDGWSIMRLLSFILIGYMSPNDHISTLIITIMLELYSVAMKIKDRHILNPIINMVGYSIGSYLN